METKLTEDLSKISGIDHNVINKILDVIGEIIVENVYEDRLRMDATTTIDLRFATLTISNIDGQLKLKFVPSKKTLGDLKNAETGKEVCLKLRLEKSVVSKLYETLRL